jgi:hypothetical protein
VKHVTSRSIACERCHYNYPSAMILVRRPATVLRSPATLQIRSAGTGPERGRFPRFARPVIPQATRACLIRLRRTEAALRASMGNM